jgi:carbon-monoxide dehydrogenase large subunit
MANCSVRLTWITPCRADDLPFYKVDHSHGNPCTHNPLGVKGCGEAGAIGSPPTVVNAVIDAMQPGGKNVTNF